MIGPKFTWQGPIFDVSQRIKEKLDRSLCNENWIMEFLEGHVKVITMVKFSNYHLIHISLVNNQNYMIKKRFIFESVWILGENYKEILER